jgi:CheY-like chemotaxis protein
MSEVPVALLVEDDALLVLSIEDELSSAGVRTFSALHGSAAVAELDSAPDRFFCLVTDINLGTEIDGWSVARHARLKNPGIVVIYVTGDSEAAWEAEGVPNSRHLKKPLVNGQLSAVIRQALDQRA